MSGVEDLGWAARAVEGACSVIPANGEAPRGKLVDKCALVA